MDRCYSCAHYRTEWDTGFVECLRMDDGAPEGGPSDYWDGVVDDCPEWAPNDEPERW